MPLQTVEMNEDEINAFGDKLDAFGASLTPKEQLLLHEILTRAGNGDVPETEGYLRYLRQTGNFASTTIAGTQDTFSTGASGFNFSDRLIIIVGG